MVEQYSKVLQDNGIEMRWRCSATVAAPLPAVRGPHPTGEGTRGRHPRLCGWPQSHRPECCRRSQRHEAYAHPVPGACRSHALSASVSQVSQDSLRAVSLQQTPLL